MRSRVRAVQADAQTHDPRLLGPTKSTQGGQRRCGGSQGHLQPDIHGMPDQIEQVGPLEWISAGQNQVRFPGKAGHLLNQRHRLLESELFGMRFLLRQRAAVKHTRSQACVIS